MRGLTEEPSILAGECAAETRAGVTAAPRKQHKTGSVNSEPFSQTTSEVILSAVFKRQLSSSQLSSR